jgi:hypothetical protein
MVDHPLVVLRVRVWAANIILLWYKGSFIILINFEDSILNNKIFQKIPHFPSQIYFIFIFFEKI